MPPQLDIAVEPFGRIVEPSIALDLVRQRSSLCYVDMNINYIYTMLVIARFLGWFFNQGVPLCVKCHVMMAPLCPRIESLYTLLELRISRRKLEEP